jgi:hypothetical protein
MTVETLVRMSKIFVTILKVALLPCYSDELISRMNVQRMTFKSLLIIQIMKQTYPTYRQRIAQNRVLLLTLCLTLT